VLWLLVIVLMGGLFALYHHFGRIYINSEEGRTSQGPELGSVPPRIPVSDLRGDPVVVPPLHGITTFMHVGCRTCKDIQVAIQEFAIDPNAVDIAVVVEGPADAIPGFVDSLGDGVLVVPDVRGALMKRLSVGAVPFAIALDGDGVVQRKAMISDRQQLELLAASVTPSAGDDVTART
jgi:hypothetical protein